MEIYNRYSLTHSILLLHLHTDLLYQLMRLLYIQITSIFADDQPLVIWNRTISKTWLSCCCYYINIRVQFIETEKPMNFAMFLFIWYSNVSKLMKFDMCHWLYRFARFGVCWKLCISISLKFVKYSLIISYEY